MPISDLRWNWISAELSDQFIRNPASHIQKGLSNAFTLAILWKPYQMSFAACPKGHKIQTALKQAVEELVPESEAISDGALPVTFKKITRGIQVQWLCWLQLLPCGLEKEVSSFIPTDCWKPQGHTVLFSETHVSKHKLKVLTKINWTAVDSQYNYF